MMTQKKKSITEVKQNREWGQERGFKTEEKKKKAFQPPQRLCSLSTNIPLLFSTPQVSFATAVSECTADHKAGVRKF